MPRTPPREYDPLGVRPIGVQTKESSENIADKRKFRELCVFVVFLGKVIKMLPKPMSSKSTFGHSTGQLNWTGPIENSSELRSGESGVKQANYQQKLKLYSS